MPAAAPSPSALHSLLHPPTTKTNTNPPDPLALQVAHNLRHQHAWSSLRLHQPSAAATTTTTTTTSRRPRPLLSGLPPRRLYTHPDELLAADTQLAPEREWVVPARVRERWSLAGVGAVFEGVGGAEAGGGLFGEGDGEGGGDARRVVLAAVEDDGTVVYYVVHDGVVKPRQN